MKIFAAGGSGQISFELQRSLFFHSEVLVPLRRKFNMHVYAGSGQDA